MLPKKLQRNYFDKRIKNILNHLREYCLTKEMGELHQLRVEIKKIDALLHFSYNCSKQKKMNKQLKPLKKIFKHAGIIRNVHISLRLSEGIFNKKFREEQKSIQLLEWEKFIYKYQDYKKSIKSMRKNLLPQFQPIKIERTLKWYKKEIKKAKDNFTDRPVNTHAARSKIKRMLYIDKLQHPHAVLNIPYLEKLENAIGDWHDITKTINVLKLEPSFKINDNKKLKKIQKELNLLIEQLSQNFKQQATSKH